MRYILDGLDCPNCAAKIERELPPRLVARAQEAIARVEPGVRLRPAVSAPSAASAPSARHAAARARAPFAAIGAAAILLAIGYLWNDRLHDTPGAWAEFTVLLTAYLLAGGRVVAGALRGLVRGDVFGERFLMTVSTGGAIAIHQLPEAAAVMVFYAAGEYLQDRAVARSRRSVAALLASRPDYANLSVDGALTRVAPEEVAPGQRIVVRPGEKVPLDGRVIEGESFVDTSPLTGEPARRRAAVGATVLAGTVNGPGMLVVEVTRPYAESSVAKILDLVENAAARKAPTERFITAFSRYYTPAVVAAAAVVAVVPPLVLPGAPFAQWVYRALVMLVISCPCALVISVPLAYFAGLGAASRRGVLVKGANFLDALSHLDTVAFDKTGTLTRGAFKVTRVVPRNGFSADEVVEVAAAAEAFSNHPIAQSIHDARGHAPAPVAPERVTDYRETPAHGITARVDGRRVVVGNDRLLHREGIAHAASDCGVEGTVVYVAVDGRLAGYIIIGDEVRPDAAETVARLKRLGVRRTVLLTGDREAEARAVAARLGIDVSYADLLPEDKVAKVEELAAALGRERRDGRRTMRAWRGARGRPTLAFVGDGVNDAPVIARADVGVAMGALGSDAAIEAADVVLMCDSPAPLAVAVAIARRTGGIVRQNVALTLGVKFFFLALGAFGLATIWEAVFADVGVTLVAVVNAARAARSG